MNLLVFMGTRPEVIKLAPVVLAARARGARVKVVFTGQHEQLAEPLLEFFAIPPDLRLNSMVKGQSLAQLSARLLDGMEGFAASVKPTDWVLVQGDTTTAFVGAYWAFLHRLPVAHVEAGLRTHDLDHPFPEEANRQMIARVASVSFAPTEGAAGDLKKENVRPGSVHVVGNTGIDALHFSLNRLETGFATPVSRELLAWAGGRDLMLLTTHRRESFGGPLEDICEGVSRLLEGDQGRCAIIPVHPNPNVRGVLERHFGQHPRARLIQPLDYIDFVSVMNAAKLILTDSGGVQEEAPSLRKPILVLRDVTERPEGVTSGFAVLVGRDPAKISTEGERALREGCAGRGENPYGDGRASERIVDILKARAGSRPH